MAACGKITTLTPWMFRRCEQAKDKILEATVFNTPHFTGRSNTFIIGLLGICIRPPKG